VPHGPFMLVGASHAPILSPGWGSDSCLSPYKDSTAVVSRNCTCPLPAEHAPSRCFLRMFLNMIAGPFKSTSSRSSPFSLLVRSASKRRRLSGCIDRRRAAVIIPRPSLPNHSRSIFILRDISALFPDPVTRLRYMVPSVARIHNLQLSSSGDHFPFPSLSWIL